MKVGYKFVTSDLKSRNGDVQWKVGEWQSCAGELKLCENGLHAAPTPLDSLQYVYGDRWFKVAARGEFSGDGDKFVAREMMLAEELPVKEVLVRFAVACAKRCYKNWKAKFPGDLRVWRAILAAEAYVKDPTEENRRAAWSAASAARSAAWSAESAARSAASAAERLWQQKTLKKLIRKTTLKEAEP
jgi:hypothetical protein